MRKKFVNVALFGALLVASLSLTTSCKDYDDDIANLQSQIDQSKTSLESSLSQQASTLQSALETAKQELNTAIQAAQSATSDADKKAEEAKAAAAQAKVDAIAEAQRLVDDLLEKVEAGYVKVGDLASYATLEYVNGKISGIEDGLGVKIQEVLDGMGLTSEVVDALKGLGDLQNILTQLETQKAAVENFTKLLGENGEVLEAKLKANLDSANAAIDEKIAEYDKVLQNYVTKSDLATELGKYCTSEEVDEMLKGVNKQIGDLSETVGKFETNFGTQISDLNELTKKIEDDVAALSTRVEEVNGNLVTLLGKTLRSLVFSPELYVGGIESTEYGYVQYYEQKAGKSDDAQNHDGKTCTFETGTKYDKTGGELYYNPVYTLKYHMNPSSAELPEAVSFLKKDVDVLTRASEKLTYTVDAISKEGGMLNVSYHLDGNCKKEIDTKATGENGTTGNIFAIEATVNKEGEDTVITSDYALLYGSAITPKAIAFTDKDHGGDECDGGTTKIGNHLYKTAKDAIEGTGVEVVYTESKDLKEFLCIHYLWESGTKNKADHGVWKYGEEEHYGLTYKFDLVDYKVTGNNTIDSRYAKVEDGVLTPYGVKAGQNGQGVTDDSKPNDRSSINREPLVRVTVVDGAGKVVLYGFIRVDILDKVEPEGTDAIEVVSPDTLVSDCDAWDYTVTWDEISEKILTGLGYDNEEFNAEYEIYQKDGEVAQFEKVGAKENEALDATHKFGTVVENTEVEGTQTSALVWTVDECTQQTIYELSGHTKTIYVCYKKKSDTQNTFRGAIFLPLKLTYKRDATIYDLGWIKKTEVWAWGANKDAGMNVQAPTDNPSHPIPYVQKFQTIFYGDTVMNKEKHDSKNELVPAGKNAIFYFLNSKFDKFDKFGKKDGEYRLVAGHTYADATDQAFHKCNGSKKDVTAENEVEYPLDPEKGVFTNDKVWCDGQEIASIDQTTGVITYAKTDKAKEILNAYGTLHYDKAEADAAGDEAGITYPQAFLKVGVAVKKECTILPIDDHYDKFNDYILRPINVTSAKAGAFVDASANGSEVNLVDVVKFIDWRTAKVGTFYDPEKPDDYHNVWLFGFYGIKSVTVGVSGDEVQAAMSGRNYAPLAEAAPHINVTYKPGSGNWSSIVTEEGYTNQKANFDIVKDILGKIIYHNNGDPIMSQFKLKFPVTVEYDWGKFTDFIEINVNEVGSGD